MAKNVIMLVIDAFLYEYIGKKNWKNTSTPFLDSLIKSKDAISINKMYSEAPYTEAALQSLLGGTDTMDNGAYMKRLSNTDCLLKEFQKNGYTVFANCLQSSIYPSGALTGVNKIYYNSSFNFKNCYDYRLKYYGDLYYKKGLTEKEYDLLKDILEDNFKEAFHFIKCLENKSEETYLLYDKLDVSHVKQYYDVLNSEYEKFSKDYKKYILEIFEEKEKHAINNLYSFPYIKKIKDEELLKEIEKRYLPVVNKIYNKNLKYNLLNNRMNIKKMNNSFKEKYFTNYFKSYLSSIFDVDLKDRVRANKYNNIKTIISANSSYKHFMSCYDELNSNGKFFAYLHVDDIHFREMFFTHDTTDLKQMDEEFNYAKEYINKLPKNYKGNLTYDLGVLYIDKQLEILFKFLNSKGSLENTDIIITADHGNSYTYQNIRENFVNNFHEENYHIPCIIYSKNNTFNINQNNFYQTKDIPATILDMNSLKIPKSYKGKSMVDFKGRDYSLILYGGTGCPDIINKPIKIAVKTKDYKVAGNVLLLDKNNFKYEEIYDLKNDYNENNNIVKKISKLNIDKEKSIINSIIEETILSNKKILE